MRRDLLWRTEPGREEKCRISRISCNAFFQSSGVAAAILSCIAESLRAEVRGVRFEHSRPDRIVIRRFRKLCAALSAMSDEIEVSVLGSANLPDVARPQPQIVPSLGWFRPAVRKAVQALDYIPWV